MKRKKFYILILSITLFALYISVEEINIFKIELNIDGTKRHILSPPDPSRYKRPLSHEGKLNALDDTSETDDIYAIVPGNSINFREMLQDKHAKNIHEFSLKEPCALNFTLVTSEEDEGTYKITLLDASNNMLTQTATQEENIQLSSDTIYLREGLYSLSVERNSLWTGQTYELHINAFMDGITEAECNNSAREANPIPLNKKVNASTGHNEDVDYFVFTLAEKSSVYPTLVFTPLNDPLKPYLKLYNLTISGRNNGMRRTFDFKGDSKPSRSIDPFTLEAGTYTVRVSLTDDRKKAENIGIIKYTLQISAEKVR